MKFNNFNWMKYRFVYALISLFFLSISLFSIFRYGFALGVEFTGGSIFEFKMSNSPDTEKLKIEIEKSAAVYSIQKIENGILVKTGNIDKKTQDEIEKIVTKATENSELVRFEQVGPTISRELLIKTATAILIATFIILFWIAYQFKSLLFGFSATIATLHDAIILIGSFSLFGHLFGAEVDFLFVTAVLTTLSFSVHDTIVVYDRIREIRKKSGGSFWDISNKALSETMRRSLFNSFTIIIMLLSLVAIGGSTMKWFASALLVGTVSGTYSSPFVAVPLLVTIDRISRRFKNKAK